MKTETLKKFLEDNYWKDNQQLNLTWDNCGSVYYNNTELFEIQTLEYCEELGWIPYFLKVDGSWYSCTVQHFGKLTRIDVIKAISYFLNLIDSFLIFNVNLDGKQINIQRPDYCKGLVYLKTMKGLKNG